MTHKITTDEALLLADQIETFWKQTGKDKEFRRVVVANLYNRKKTQTEIARLLGVSIDRIHRDILSLYRASFSSVYNPAESQDYLSPQRRGLSSDKRNIRARDKRAYCCNDCSVVFHGSGSWQTSRKHARDYGHYVTRAGKLKYGPKREMLALT